MLVVSDRDHAYDFAGRRSIVEAVFEDLKSELLESFRFRRELSLRVSAVREGCGEPFINKLYGSFDTSRPEVREVALELLYDQYFRYFNMELEDLASILSEFKYHAGMSATIVASRFRLVV